MRTTPENRGDRIKRLREAAGYSQMRLCRVTGISQATLYRAEVGGVVSLETARRLAVALGVSPSSLVDGVPAREGESG